MEFFLLQDVFKDVCRVSLGSSMSLKLRSVEANCKQGTLSGCRLAFVALPRFVIVRVEKR